MEYVLIAENNKEPFARFFSDGIGDPKKLVFHDITDKKVIDEMIAKSKNWSYITNDKFHDLMHNLTNCEDSFYGFQLKTFCKGDVYLIQITDNIGTFFENPNDLMMLKLKG